MLLGVHVSKCSSVIKKWRTKKSRSKGTVEKVYEGEKRKTMKEAICNDVGAYGFNYAQIYTHGPRNSKKNNIDTKAVQEFCQEKKITLNVHCSHVLSRVLWSDKNYVAELLGSELKSASELKSPLLVHLPDSDIKYISVTLQRHVKLFGKYKVKLLFENVPTKVGSANEYCTADQLNKLCLQLEESLTPICKWGICIDTAHMWSCGVKLSDPKVQNDWIKNLEDLTVGKISLIHLNGSSKKTFCCGRDKHFIVASADDDIYKTSDGKESLSLLVNFAKKHSIPICCEINRGTNEEVAESLKLIRSL
jgi:endonuclease IV